MAFNSLTFLVFFAIVLAVHSLPLEWQRVDHLDTCESKLLSALGLPVTPAFGGQYSIQLSDGRLVGTLSYRSNDNSPVAISN